MSFSELKDLFQRGPEKSRIWALEGMILYAPHMAELYSKLIQRLIDINEFERAKLYQGYNKFLCNNLDFFSNEQVHRYLTNKKISEFNIFIQSLDPEVRFPDEDFLIFEKLLNEGSSVLNIGALHGATAFFMSKLGAENIVSVEPNPDFHDILNNLEIKNHKILHLGLSNKVGYGYLYCPVAHPGRANILEKRELATKIFGIKIDTIDNLKLNNFNYWKIDVEGSELKIIEGAYHTLEKSPPDIIQVEAWDKNINKLVGVLSKFNFFSYTCQVDHNFSMRFFDFERNMRPWKTLKTKIMVFSRIDFREKG